MQILAAFDAQQSPVPMDLVFFAPGTDIKKVEDKMAEALVGLDSWKRPRAEEKREPLLSDQISKRPKFINPAIHHCSNSALINSSALNSSASKLLGSHI